MAGGAVPQSFHQIAPAIPLHRLARVGLLDARLEIQRAPRGQQGAWGVGEVEFGWTVGLADGRHAAQVGIKRVGIGARDARVFGVREGRIQQGAVFGLAVVQGLPEIVGGPGADARLVVRRDVRPIHRAKRRRDRCAAVQRLAAPAGVAGHAVARQRQAPCWCDRACPAHTGCLR
ncbi:hypothetical protein G6F68_016198 [Rhizopus microsporus]|nr:hypothetical protein G6F68_016198 [Rhizopus microsporus]